MHSAAKHPVQEKKSSGFKLPSFKLIGSLIVLFVVVAGASWLATQPRSLQLADQNDHWHAGFELKICGQKQPDFAYSQGDVHTHGDGKIHVHPHSLATSGNNANLAAFFSSVGIAVSNNSLALPGGKSFKNGDACPDGSPGRVRVTVGGAELQTPFAYVVQDGDFVRVEFAS